MRVIDQDTGETYYLDITPDLSAELASYTEAECKHTEVEIRQRRKKGGSLHIYRQCLACGMSVGSALKKSAELTNLPPWNEGHEERHAVGRKAEYEAIIQKYVRKQKKSEEETGRKYDVYLKSPEWHAKRAKVLKRANGICQGCLERKATQVHHLTYEHIFEEFMFELVPVCDECHARLHADKSDDPVSAADENLRSEWEEHYPCDGCRHGDENNGRRWCGILNQYSAAALALGGDCGPKRASFEPLK